MKEHCPRNVPGQGLLLLTLQLACLLPGSNVNAQASYDGLRWFDVEISIFTNDYPEYRNAELWTPERLQLEYPERIREFSSLGQFLSVAAFETATGADEEPVSNLVPMAEPPGDLNTPVNEPVLPPVGPFMRQANPELRLPDFARDPYLLLPASLSDFQTTNSRLQRSSTNRLLFTGHWRQPVLGPGAATALLVRGGQQRGSHTELEGSITIRFNQNEDRVVLDTNLWLTEFSAASSVNNDWALPPAPGAPADDSAQDPESASGAAGLENRRPGISRIVQMRQSRPMRSDEFHYLDHPALGIVISVKPYDRPPPVIPGMPVEAPGDPTDLLNDFPDERPDDFPGDIPDGISDDLPGASTDSGGIPGTPDVIPLQ